jgi:hypothetical protein
MKEFKPEELFKDTDDIEILKQLTKDYIHQKVVLGIDIYKYSQYPLVEQIYVPVLFNSIYRATVGNILAAELFFFNDYGKELKDFESNFISTGDGGYQILDNPVQAVIFALTFQVNVKRFVSGSNTLPFRKKLHQIIDSIELRYAITSDLIYSYNSNFFGPGIINNARILSKDSLNRLLIDANTMKWFTNNINSVENLMDLNKTKFIQTIAFKGYNKTLNSRLFNLKSSFKSVDILKIGSITAKNTPLDIYNLHIQALVSLVIDKHRYKNFIITLGNLNTSGINDKNKTETI